MAVAAAAHQWGTPFAIVDPMDRHAAPLLIVSGPSCSGKSPLVAAAQRMRPALFHNLSKLVLYHSRGKRPGEEEGKDYYFRTRAEIASFQTSADKLVWPVRDDLQALDLPQLEEKLGAGRVLYEGNFRIALDLQERYRAKTQSVYLSPLSASEIEKWRALRDTTFDDRVIEMMRRRLLRRTHKQKAHLAWTDLKSIERRAADAPNGLRAAHRFDFVISNHDGEDSDHWDLADEPIGDARRAVEAWCCVLEGKPHPHIEQFGPGTVPEPDGPSADGQSP